MNSHWIKVSLHSSTDVDVYVYVGSLWLENDLHENELEFESHMGRSKKYVRVISDALHGNPRDLSICIAPAAPPLCHAAVNPCHQSKFP